MIWGSYVLSAMVYGIAAGVSLIPVAVVAVIGQTLYRRWKR